MKIVLYSDDYESANKVAIKARAERHHVRIVSEARFEAPRDLERCDAVWLLAPSAKIQEAYGSRDVDVYVLEEIPSGQVPANEPEAAEGGADDRKELTVTSAVKKGDVVFAGASLFADAGVPSNFEIVMEDGTPVVDSPFDVNADGAVFIKDRGLLDFRKVSTVNLFIAATIDDGEDIIRVLPVHLAKGGA